MITTGSKYFFGLAGFALLAAFVYGIATSGHELNMDSLVGVVSLGYKGTVGDQFGYGVLVALFGTSVFLGSATSAFRDADPEAEAQLLHLDTVPEAAAPQGVSYWPILAAFGAGLVVIGFVVGAPLVMLGAATLAVATFEWASRAWSERLTGDAAINRTIRNRVLFPVEIPLLAVVGIAIAVLAISRVLLALPKTGSYIVFGAVPALILLVGWFFTTKPKVNKSVLTALLLLVGVAVLAAGIVGAAVGPRKVEEHKEEGGFGVVVPPGAPVTVSTGSGGQPA